MSREPWRPLTTRSSRWPVRGRGLTNAEIAEELGLSPKTVSAHLEHILAKLGATRRTEIATWVAFVAGGAQPSPRPVTDIAAPR